MKIIVYILTKTPESVKYDCFDNHFIVKYITLNAVTTGRFGDDEKNYYEFSRFVHALNDCNENYFNNYCIVMKDTSVCQIKPRYLYHILNKTINLKNWDITYLCRWLDNQQLCESLYEDKRSNISILRTYSPHGIQCLMFSPKGREKILKNETLYNGKYFSINYHESLDNKLNEIIIDEQFIAIGYSRNIFSYDYTKIRNNSDILKFSLYTVHKEKKVIKTYPISYYITIVGLSATLLIAYHQIQYGSK